MGTGALLSGGGSASEGKDNYAIMEAAAIGAGVGLASSGLNKLLSGGYKTMSTTERDLVKKNINQVFARKIGNATPEMQEIYKDALEQTIAWIDDPTSQIPNAWMKFGSEVDDMINQIDDVVDSAGKKIGMDRIALAQMDDAVLDVEPMRKVMEDMIKSQKVKVVIGDDLVPHLDFEGSFMAGVDPKGQATL
jgi:hypothetical protein